jgi:hypothetical protein
MRKQTALWWAQDVTNEYGQHTYLFPESIRCRWDDMQKEIILKNGTKYLTKSIVYPDRVLKIGDYLFRDTMDLDTGTPTDFLDPRRFDGAFEVVGFDQIPNLKNTETLYIAYL